ncbi:MAG: FAD-dependent oxidoreductase, partial [Planctomycetes bacterium]|nr:FAD-dependent oxidoreductase [Planctomycetota bacterium]
MVGASIAGIAAALALREAGRSVVLIDRQAAPGWECGWTFALDAGGHQDPAWQRLAAAWSAAGALDQGRIAGAVAEVACTGLLADAGVAVLGYQTPVAVERDRAGALSAVLVAGKSGFARVAAGRWIDASEDGELARLLDPALAPAAAPASRILIAWQRETWADNGLDLGRIDGAGALRWQPGRWANERQLVLDLPGDGAGFRRWWLPMLDRLRDALGGELAAAQASHASWLPLPLWAEARPPRGALLHGNLCLAV